MQPNPFLDRSFFEELFSYFADTCSKLGYGVKEKKGAVSGPVTELDIKLQRHVQSVTRAWREEHNISFIGEENKAHSLSFPCVIVDPLDGTSGFIRGEDDYSMALSWHAGPGLNDAHVAGILSPKHQLVVTSLDGLMPRRGKLQGRPLSGLVSSSEYSDGLFKGKDHPNLEIAPMGSIALKLGMLAIQKADFVVSLRPKWIWDIAAGSCLNAQQGLEFWSEGKKVTELNQLHFRPPLIWAPRETVPLIVEFCSQT